MKQTIQAMVNQHGQVTLLEDVKLTASCRAIVLISDEFVEGKNEPALLAQHALAKEWLNPEEDKAWAYLQPAK